MEFLNEKLICDNNIKLKYFDTLPDEDTMNKLARMRAYGGYSFDKAYKYWQDFFTRRRIRRHFVVVAEDKEDTEKFIGSVKFSRQMDIRTNWFISGLGVLKDYRRLGIGTAMEQYGIEIIKKKKGEAVIVAVSNTNTPSICLHEKQGFRKLKQKELPGWQILEEEDLYKLKLKENAIEEIELREVEETDYLFLHQLMNNPVIQKILHQPDSCEEEWLEYIKLWKADSDEKDFIIYCNNNPVGLVGLNGLNSSDKSVWIKILALLPEYQERFIGTYALSKCFDLVFALSFTEIRLFTDKDNKVAQRLYEKFGFKIEKEIVKKMPDGAEYERVYMVRKLKSDIVTCFKGM